MFIRRLNNTLGGCEFSGPQWNSHRAPSLFFLRVHLQVGERKRERERHRCQVLMTGSPSETPFGPCSRPHIKLVKLNSPRERDDVVVRDSLAAILTECDHQRERYIIDRGSHRSQRWCDLSNSVRKFVPYTTTTSITLWGASCFRMRRARGRAVNASFKRATAHGLLTSEVARSELASSTRRARRMWSVLWRSTHPHSFIYAVWRNHLAVEKLKVDVIWQAAECMTDTSCGISGRTKSLMLRLNRHRPLNDWLSETFDSLKVSQTMMIHLHSQNTTGPGQIYSQWVMRWTCVDLRSCTFFFFDPKSQKSYISLVLDALKCSIFQSQSLVCKINFILLLLLVLQALTSRWITCANAFTWCQ